jgi:hypothetical protein
LGQSVFAAHAAHCPMLVMQMGEGCAQSVDARHSTQPSDESHVWLPRH